jgi:predicted nucleic acid-binding protein
MSEPVMLDSSPLGRLARPKAGLDIVVWYGQIVSARRVLILPEIADYEVRRSLLLNRFDESIRLLDKLKQSIIYQPITTAAMLRAAELWADARRRGRPTADPKELDADVILAAMALESAAIVATENGGHLSRYVTAKHWKHITP